MGRCNKTFGKVIIFVAVNEKSFKTAALNFKFDYLSTKFGKYAVVQESLRCYLKSADYEFKLVDLDHDKRVNRLCKNKDVFYKKHCAASIYLAEADWMLILDADSGVVNPIEEWIDDRVDLVFYERFFNWEIASGNYLAKNTKFARNFLMKWANWEFVQPKKYSGVDNGALQIHILQTVLPDAKAEIRACNEIWYKAYSYETYMLYVTCVKIYLGTRRLYPGQLRILRRGHGWVRDGGLMADTWAETDFFLRGWKKQAIDEDNWPSPFSRMFNVSECTPGGYGGWNWRPEKRLSVADLRVKLAKSEVSEAKKFPKEARFLLESDVGLCYPHCDDDTWNS